jgi:RNA polymerase sigma-70 factor (ECF subfamily)
MAPEDVPDVATVPTSDSDEVLGHVYAILRGMNPDERIALVLHRVQGLPLEEGARATGTSVATFRRRLARGDAKFFARAKGYPALDAWIAAGEAP